MKMKGLAAAALAGLTLLGAAPVASARHKAEEYMEAVQREKAERMREEQERAARQRALRRRRTEERPLPSAAIRTDETGDKAPIEDGAQEESGAAEKELSKAAAPKAENEREEIASGSKAENEHEEIAARPKEESAPRAEEAPAATDEMVEWHRREGDEKRREETPPAAKDEGTEPTPLIDFSPNDAKDTREAPSRATQKDGDGTKEEGLLAKYLRRARERASGAVPQDVPRVESGAKVWRVAKPEPMKPLAVDTTDTGGTLIFSDSPEYVTEPGILYSDIVKGDARVFYYHLNDTKKNHKVAVVLENDSGQFAVLRVTRSAMPAPSDNYFQVGRGLQEIYFGDGQRPENLYVASGEKRLLSEAMDKTILKPGDLVAGVFDFSASAPVRVSVIFYPVGEDPLEFVKEAKILPNDEHRMRGTFLGTDRVIRARRAYKPGRDGLRCLMIGDGKKDTFLQGVDATDGRLAENRGNYGVLYRLEIPVAGGKTMRAFMSPMGGSYGGIVRVEEKKAPGFCLIGVPEGALCYGEHSIHPAEEKDGSTRLEPSGDLAEIGTYRGKTEVFFEMSPPGASNLPVLLILAPEDLELRKDAPEPAEPREPKPTK